MNIELPEFCLVVLRGAPERQLQAVAAHCFSDQAVAMELADLERRLQERRLALVLDTGRPEALHQTEALATAKRYHAPAFALDFSHHIGEPVEQRRSGDGHRFRQVFQVPRELACAEIVVAYRKVQGDFRQEMGPFDIIGDVHGCADELETLLAQLGYRLVWSGARDRDVIITPPAGRRLVFVGDLVDRGPRTPDVLRIVMAAVEQGAGFCVPGNHDTKFLRWMLGRDVTLNHGLEKSVEQMAGEAQSFHERARHFLDGLDVYFWCDGGRLLVAHAGIRQSFIGRLSRRIRRFCLYGDTSGQKDEAGLPVRYHWAHHYSGEVAIAYGHTPVAEPGWVNNTLCVDTGCCFGGMLTALRWPERETVSVPALAQYAVRRRPFGHPPVRPV